MPDSHVSIPTSDVDALIEDVVITTKEAALADTNSTAVINHNNNERKDMKEIFTFLREFRKANDEGVLQSYYYSITTTVFRDINERNAYVQSLESHRIVNGVFAISQGAYRFRLMEELCNKFSIDFRAVTMETKDLGVIDFRRRSQNCSLSWATDSKAFFVYIQPAGLGDFSADAAIKDGGFKMLGLTAEYTKKITKRFQEIFRSSEMNIFIDNEWEVLWTRMGAINLIGKEHFQDPHQLVFAEFPTPEGMDDKLFDGVSFVDADLVLRALEEQPIRGNRSDKKIRNTIKDLKSAIRNVKDNPDEIFVGRYIFRVLGERGLIKGDGVAVVGLKANTGADVIFHTENLKKELRTEGFTSITFEVHHPIHSTTLDSQTLINLRSAIPQTVVRRSIAKLLEQGKSTVEQETPDWLKLSPQTFSELNSSDGMHEQLKVDYKRWLSYDERLTVEMSQNFGFLWAGGMVKKMGRNANSKTGLNKKPWIPALNTVSLGVMTNSALKLMAGYDAGATEGLVFVENVGVVFPDHRWVECYELHGGYDLDDTVNTMAVKFWVSDMAHLELLRADGVIDPSIEIPTSADEAVELALTWRMPNGAGEYSIQRTQTLLPYKNLDDTIEVIDLAKLPRGQQALFDMCDQVGDDVPADPTIVYSSKENMIEFNKDHALYILEAQQMNQGIGAVANALMVWANAMGPSYPPIMASKLENLVDATQSGHDKVSISAVAEASKSILMQLANAMKADPNIRVDRLLVTERLSGQTGEYMDVLRGRMTNRRPTEMSDLYMAAIREIREHVAATLLQKRAETSIAVRVRGMRFHADTAMWASHAFNRANRELQMADRINQINPKDPTFLKMAKKAARAEMTREIIAKLVEEVKRVPEKELQRATALYQVALLGNRNWTNGFYDRVIFQSAGNEEAVFDLLAKAFIKFMPR